MNQPQKSLDGQFASGRTWLASFCFGIKKVLVLHEVGVQGPDAVSFTEDANAEQILKSSLLAGFKVTEHSFHQCPTGGLKVAMKLKNYTFGEDGH